MLDGGFGETNGFGSGASWTRSILTTDYTAWKIGLKSAADHTFGALTMTPSLSVFAGHASNRQSFFQELDIGVSPSNRNYRANRTHRGANHRYNRNAYSHARHYDRRAVTHRGARGRHWRHVQSYRSWHRGGRLARGYWRGRPWVNWRAHALWAPPYGYQWVYVGGYYMLIAIGTGLIADIVVAY